MRKTMTALSVLLGLAFGCGDDSELPDGGENTTAGSGATGSRRSGVQGADASTAGTTAGSAGSTEAGDSGMGPAPGVDGGADPGSTDPDPGSSIPTDGNQLSSCDDNEDCNDGLNCYAAGNFCSQACAEDADCASLGPEYTCATGAQGFGPGGGFPGGGFPGGGFQDGGFPGGGFADAGAGTPTGTCRITCDGEDDTSCPSGMRCLDVAESSGGNPFGGNGNPFGGFPGAGDAGATTGTFRCGYPDTPPGQPGPDGGAGTGSTPAFGECQESGECADGFMCTAFPGSSGYCAQSCMDDSDCTDAPASGTAMPSCGFGVMCTLDCSGDETCPDGMSCTSFGGGFGGPGGMGPAFCNY
jgi:hypothetical protein